MSASDGPKSSAELEAVISAIENADESVSGGSIELLLLLKGLHASTRLLEDEDLQPLYAQRGVRLLSRFAFREGSEHIHALRCLNNILVRSAPSRQILVSESDPAQMVATFKRQEPDDQAPLANILIFCSHGTSLDLTQYLENDGLAEAVNTTINGYAKTGVWPTSQPTSPCAASLRLLSTLAARYEDQSHLFFDSIDPVLEMLSKVTIPSPPLENPVSLLVNCIPVLPIHKKKSISIPAVDKIIEIVKDSISYYGIQDKAPEFLPLLMAVHRIAQSQAPEAKDRLKATFIPSPEDRKLVLGKGTTLPHIMLYVTNHSMIPEVRELIMATYFELSDKDPSQFVHNIGFGNAAGYLATKGIHLSQKDFATSDADGPEINPITGQRIDAEPDTPLPEMSREEKEREAERLFVLFQRLKQTGVVDVENPVAAAAQSGRIQELSDSSDDDD